MNKEKISSQEIIDLVSSKALVSKRVAEDFLKALIASIEDALLAGEVVKIKNFGTFKLQWNEPRKSVNVQTGEDIILAGYHKVNFTPDIILKDLVNEPFAHLTPVEFDSENPEPIKEKTEVTLDPLRIFEDQASEIKDLLSEIQALTPIVAPKVSRDKPQEILVVNPLKEAQVVEQKNNEEQVIESILEEKIDTHPVESISFQDDELKTNEPEEPKQSFDSSQFLNEVKPSRRKRKVWLIILVIIVLLAGTETGLYFFYQPAKDFTITTVKNSKASVSETSKNISISDMINTVSLWFTNKPKQTSITETVIVPKDTTANDSVDVIKPVDSLQIMFNNPRVYSEFIATERIKPGSRLTLMAKRYYGNKAFWVYIYEANQDKISNPDKISKGILIRIPKLDPRLIDSTNPRCILKAKELHNIYVK